MMITSKPINYLFIAYWLIAVLPLPAEASLGDVGDIQTLMTRLERVLPAFWGLMVIIAYVAGLGFFLKGLLMLKAFSAPLTQQTRPGEISGPLVYLFVGTMMLWIAPSTDIISRSIFGSDFVKISIAGSDTGIAGESYQRTQASSELLSYAPVSIEGEWAAMFNTIVIYIRFIGFLAFIRGWFLIAHAGQPGVQPGTISKGLVHLVGGIMAINFVPLVKIIHNTVAVG